MKSRDGLLGPGQRNASLGRRISRLSVAIAVALSVPLWSDPVRSQDSANADVRAFDRFVTTSTPLCLNEAAEACIDAAWLMADLNRDRLLSLDELSAVVRSLSDWARWKKPDLHEKDWTGLQLGLLVMRTIGLGHLFESFDTNGDLGLSQSELLADVKLDSRPLREILTDRSAIDWDSVTHRLGSFAGLVNGTGSPD